MQFIEIEVRTAIVSHGYDANNVLMEESVNETDYVRKIVALDRVRSISESYILVTSQGGREMYWEYKGSLEDIKQKLLALGANVA